MARNGVATRVLDEVTKMTHFPPSMNENPLLYALALISVMCIACLGFYVVIWMIRDSWHDRKDVRPKSLLFNFRIMMGLAGLAAFTRSMPEVLYLQMYGDPEISTQTQAYVMVAKRVADGMGLWMVLGWVIMLVLIYPSVCVALNTGVAKFVEIERKSIAERLARPLICFICIAAASSTFVYYKVYGS